MIFKRKKKKNVVDDNQLLLFTIEEMKGGEAPSSNPNSTPLSTGSDEGLHMKQFPIATTEQIPEDSLSSCNVSTTEATEPAIVQESVSTVSEDGGADSQESSFQITDNRYSADHHLLLESMHKAILRLSTMNINDIRLVAIESASHAQNGINTEHTYYLQALKGMELSGYDFIAYYYVSFARSFPTMLDKIDLPFSDIYEEALSLGR